MDQSALVLILAALALGGKPLDSDRPNWPHLTAPVSYCSAVARDWPRVSEIELPGNSSSFVPNAETAQKLRQIAEYMRKHNCGIRLEGVEFARNPSRDAARRNAVAVEKYLTDSLLPADLRVKGTSVEVGDGQIQIQQDGATRHVVRIFM